MKAGWKVKPLSQICEVKGGKRVPKGYKLKSLPTVYPYISVADFTENGTVSLDNIRYIDREIFEQIKNYTISSDDLYISIAGTIGKTGFVPEELSGASLTENACKLVLGPEVDKGYLYHVTRSEAFSAHVKANTRTAAQPKLSLERLKTILIPLPPIEEQQQIVAVLDEAFEGLARARAHAEANLRDARELFESIKANALEHEGADSIIVTLDEVVEIYSSLVDPRQEAYADLQHLGAGNMVTGSDELVGVKTAREEKLISGKYTFDKNTVLYSKIRPYLRKAARPTFRGLCSADVYPLTPKDGCLDRDYLFHLLLGRDFTEYAISGSDRAGMPKVNRDHLFRYSFSLPPIAVQEEIASRIDAAHAATGELEKLATAKLEKINTLRQSLLRKAFLGELT